MEFAALRLPGFRAGWGIFGERLFVEVTFCILLNRFVFCDRIHAEGADAHPARFDSQAQIKTKERKNAIVFSCQRRPLRHDHR